MRRFFKSFKKFSNPLRRLDTIANDADMHEKPLEELRFLGNTIIERCRIVLKEHEALKCSEKTADANGTGKRRRLSLFFVHSCAKRNATIGNAFSSCRGEEAARPMPVLQAQRRVDQREDDALDLRGAGALGSSGAACPRREGVVVPAHQEGQGCPLGRALGYTGRLQVGVCGLLVAARLPPSPFFPAALTKDLLRQAPAGDLRVRDGLVGATEGRPGPQSRRQNPSGRRLEAAGEAPGKQSPISVEAHSQDARIRRFQSKRATSLIPFTSLLF